MRLASAVRRRVVTAARRHPLTVDAAFGAVIALIYVLAMLGREDSPRRQNMTTTILVATLIAAAVAWIVITIRRRWPRTALLVTAGASLVFIVLGHAQPVLMPALVITAYTMASRTERRPAWTLAAVVAFVLFGAGLLWSADGWLAPQNIGTLAWIGMATAVGDAARTRRAYIAEVEERAHRAEQTREEEARRRVAEERIRIARELHDVVAHHIAVINVQAGAAAHVLHDRPEEVGPALAQIRRAADTVVKELASVVGVLRQPDDTSTEPTRGLARLDELLDSVAAAGLPVRRHQHGEPRDLPAVVDLAAFRIVQEALTNAHKHGPGGAELTITYDPATVTVEVTNPVRPADRPMGDPGYGIIGMRERAAATGGAISIGPRANDTFVVRATLPCASDAKRTGAEARR